MNSTKKTARVAGLIWFLSAVTGGFGLFYIRSNVIMVGDVAATAGNIMASEFLFRAAIVSNLFSQIFLFLFGLTLFHVFKEVNRVLKYFGLRIFSHSDCSSSNPNTYQRSWAFC